MRSTTQFLASVFTRQVLGFVIFAALALLTWFIGSDLAFDGLRPLATDAARISCALLLVLLAGIWLFSGPLSIVVVAGLMVLVWQAGPLLSLRETRPLEPLWVRLVIVAAIALACGLYWLGRLLGAMRENEEFLSSMLAIGRRRGEEEVAKEELKDVDTAARRALAQLRTLRVHDGAWGRVFEGNRYLHELPWYLVIGSPGAGKTTALRNAGLQFPVSAPADSLAQSTRFGSDNGTLHCDWWLANEAVLIDTAGRYATHDSDPAKDASEWRGFLRLLRKYRTRAPINGALLMLSMAELLQMSPSQRGEHATRLRDRLAELRRQLGIRFPVYIFVTKMDVLRGFAPYFQSLTSDARSQAWGFALTHGRGSAIEPTPATNVLPDEIGEGLRVLERRLADGLRARISEEFDTERRRMLFALPSEFSAAAGILREVVDPVFLDSRFDFTQSSSMLRGIYFTSAAQTETELPADPQTVLQRLTLAMGDGRPGGPGTTSITAPADARPSHAGQGFFIHDVLKKVIFPEAHLVRPNLRWEARYRAMRLIGHLAVLGLLVSFSMALMSSFSNNRGYLTALDQRADALTARMRVASSNPDPARIAELLDAARALPVQPGLELDAPSMRFRYGLYSAPSPAQAASAAYAELQAALLLPPVLRRMEWVLSQSLKNSDSPSAYETLRVYKLLHDRKRYVEAGGAASVREWLRRDAQASVDLARRGVDDRSGMADLAGRASTAPHFDALFSNARVVQAGSLPDESLVHAVQQFLDGDTLTQRLYDRAKAAMQPDAPPDFTLLRAVGPQAGTVFTRIERLPLDHGVPGLFTYDGYHRIFAPRVLAYMREALDEDTWVMGRHGASGASDPVHSVDTCVAHVRQQYLTEFAKQWDDFLGSVRTVGFVDTTAIVDKGSKEPVEGGGLGFDLSVLRQLAAPDSPLSRLARASVRETTLSRQADSKVDEKRTFLDRTAEVFASKPAPDEADGAIGDRRHETEFVDNHFAALREVVTGSADASTSAKTVGTSGGKPSLDTITGLLNDFYTWMVVADTALSAGGLPPGGADAGARLRLEAGRLPAPFKEILAGVAVTSGAKVMQGTADILRRQAQVQVDRLMALLAVQVSEPCKRGLEGRYPFAAVAQDASIEDFTLVFATGGALDEFFSKHLAALVDTSTRPWRYRSPEGAAAQAAVEASTGGLVGAAMPAVPTGATLLGETLKLLARDGPNLEPFRRGQQVREVFFREGGGKKMAWKIELSVRELEPTITELSMDIDGQSQRYVHGPIQPLVATWPGPRGGAAAEITAQPRISAATSTASAQGPWALFRLFDKGRVVETATPGRLNVEYVFDGRKALIEIGTGSQPHPLNSDLLKGFRCPGRTA